MFIRRERSLACDNIKRELPTWEFCMMQSSVLVTECLPSYHVPYMHILGIEFFFLQCMNVFYVVIQQISKLLANQQ